MKRAIALTIDYLKKADLILLTLSIACSIFGLVLIWSSTQNRIGGATSFLVVQIAALILGIMSFVFFSVIDVEVMAQRWKALFVFNVLLLISLVFFGVGEEVGSRNWLRFFGIGIQPSEIVKITYIMMLAYHVRYLKEYKNINSFFSLMQLAAHLGLLLVLLPDLGNALIFMFVFLVVLFLAGVKLRWFALGFSLFAAAAPILWRFLGDYQRERILAPYVDAIDPLNLGRNLQAHQSRIAIASGQITGQGLGEGMRTQAGTVPEQWTDFIFSVVGEELGIVGALVVMLLLAVIIVRCFHIAAKSRDTLSGLTCAGVGAFMLFQTLVNIGMTLGLTPVVGIALPFFGYGGSSLVTTFMGLGLVCGAKMKTVSPWKRPL